MKKVPCETAVWEILPAIRRELVISLKRDFALSQRETAKLLGITEAAVSQYIRAKRGENLAFTPVVLNEIKNSARNIMKNPELTAHELCKICSMVQHNYLCVESKKMVKRERNG
jgi:predicted transcriptional regulator